MDALAERMTAAQFAEWQDFAALEPWGCEEEWNRTGMVCSTVVNANPFRGKAPAAKVADFVRKPPPSPELLAELSRASKVADKVLRGARPGVVQVASKQSFKAIREAAKKLPNPPQPKEATNVPVDRPRNRRQRPN